MKNIKNLVLVIGITLGIGLFVPVNAGAASAIDAQCVGITEADKSAVCSDKDAKPNNLIANIINTLLYVVGALSVIMIIVGGLLYATSNADASRITMAKNTIMYAIVGLVVAFLAYAIVQFVVAKFG